MGVWDKCEIRGQILGKTAVSNIFGTWDPCFYENLMPDLMRCWGGDLVLGNRLQIGSLARLQTDPGGSGTPAIYNTALLTHFTENVLILNFTFGFGIPVKIGAYGI